MEGKVVEYCVVAELDPRKQSIEVNKFLGEGYELYGFPVSYPSGEICVFTQVMVKREKHEQD